MTVTGGEVRPTATSTGLRAYDALLFDLDGTLVDSGAAIERAWRGWSDRHGLDAERVLETSVGRRGVETVALVAPHLDSAREAGNLEAGQARDTVGVVPTPGAGIVLAAAAGGPWAVVTSGTRPVALARLRAAGLPVPTVLVTADDVTAGKPDPQGYLLAARRLGVEAGRCVVFEDTWPGVLAGQRAGMAVVGIAGAGLGATVTPDLVVDRLSRLDVRWSSGTVSVTLRPAGDRGDT
ncbi:hypothetical protein AWW66_01415 [Micromonospora rosaria]|uniref:HAD family hydrolase n=1 Tax=Micromonospora rosaria TaxID=47874 RepID=A0A136PYY1_9ACTN|nr:HAD-IA family hydrolase [Micromonospora rosaria]KXK63652.1 hypothetical protein AWW66_01415 [Micromonospora rosaria]